MGGHFATSKSGSIAQHLQSLVQDAYLSGNSSGLIFRLIATGVSRRVGLPKLVLISVARIALGASPQPEAPLRRQNLSKIHGQPVLRTHELRHHVSVDPIPVVQESEVSA